ncbi:MAG: hypothetical protein M1277_01835 [Patescibacteria group bacterium]|nr:hypothetical protein [Patescibacteria group bacterium]
MFTKTAFAIYDPTSTPNNSVGIHILFPTELSDAAKLVNSSGGDWGYVTIPIQQTDMDLTKWQTFMDNCGKYHLIPIIRLATTGDYFNQSSWEVPNNYDVLDFANFLNSLNWPTKNRYVIIYNEPNNGDEWGGTPDPAGYAQILDYAVHVFKQRSSDFFILSAGLDNAAANVNGKSVNEYDFMREMNYAVPGVFGEIDGIASHSYPNPGFSQPPLQYGYEGVSSFRYEDNLAESLGGKTLPVFITETGWSSDKIPESVQAVYYSDAFSNIWDDKNVIAVTPFLLNAGSGPYAQFSFIKSGTDTTDIYKAVFSLKKIKGEPQINKYQTTQNATVIKEVLPVKSFNANGRTNYTATVSRAGVLFFKWLLNF